VKRSFFSKINMSLKFTDFNKLWDHLLYPHKPAVDNLHMHIDDTYLKFSNYHVKCMWIHHITGVEGVRTICGSTKQSIKDDWRGSVYIFKESNMPPVTVQVFESEQELNISFSS